MVYRANITPVMFGDAAKAARFAELLPKKGIAIAFSYPVVPQGRPEFAWSPQPARKTLPLRLRNSSSSTGSRIRDRRRRFQRNTPPMHSLELPLLPMLKGSKP